MLRKILKWVGIVLGGLVGFIVLALMVVLIYGQMKEEDLKAIFTYLKTLPRAESKK